MTNRAIHLVRVPLALAALALLPRPSARADDQSPDQVATLLGRAFDPAELPAPAEGTVPPSFVPHFRFFDTVRESIFGDAYAKPSTWHPLSLRTLFTEGWDEAYVNPPAGRGGAPRSGWINSFDGNLFRAWFVVFGYQNDLNHDGNGYVGTYSIYVPLNSRLEFRFDTPFIVSNKGGANNGYHGNFGDLTFTPRLLLSATQDVTQILAMPARRPTGNEVNFNGVASLSPQYQFWVNPFGGWAVRGGTGVAAATNRAGGRTEYIANLAAGHYWKGDENGWIRHFWLTLAANFNTPIAGTGANTTFLGLTPGMRVQITGYWYFLAGVEVPVVAPRAFDYAPTFLILKDY